MAGINQVLDQTVLDKIEGIVNNTSYVSESDRDDLRSFIMCSLIEAYYAGRDIQAATTTTALKRRTIDFARASRGESSRQDQENRLIRAAENQPGHNTIVIHRSIAEPSNEFEDETTTSIDVRAVIDELIESGDLDDIDLAIIDNMMSGETPILGIELAESTAYRRVRRVQKLLREKIEIFA